MVPLEPFIAIICTLGLGSTEPLTVMSTWGGKGGRWIGWQPYHLHLQIVLKSGNLIFLGPSGPVQNL